VEAFAASGAQQTPEVLAQGLYHIVSLGVPAAHAMDVLKLASEGAAVGHANLEDVANALGAAVASNIKGSGDYTNAMAVLNATVGAGNMRMQDLATSLGNVLPQATTAGLSLTDVGAAMATMTDNGMPAADAATRLHMAISLMEAPTGKAEKALARASHARIIPCRSRAALQP
jgi:TP901 family phage tail tape measure protein